MAVETKIMEKQVKELYAKFTARKLLFMIAGSGALILLAVVASSLGAASLGVAEVAGAIAHRIFPFASVEVSELAQTIVWDLRLPRVLMAVVAGMGFAVSGAAMQGIMRNPLVSPFTIGISSGAGFGASLAIVLGIGVVGPGKYLSLIHI